MRRLVVGTALAGAGLALCTPRAAHAERSADILSVGYLHSERWGGAGSYGNGAELTFVDYRGRGGGGGLGGFLHLESVDGSRLGFSAGPQLNYWIFGLETGLDHLGASREQPAALGWYAGAFVSVGVVSLGWHGVLAETPGHAFTLALKLPLPLHVDANYFRFGGGG